MEQISQRIADELNVKKIQVSAAVALLDEGSTVPFISRYRKEATGGLDDTQLRNLEERLRYLRELEDRRSTVLKSIEDQGKLTDELHAGILGADTKTRLEDLYLPYKPKRRTKAQIAREAGLEPLANLLFDQPETDPQSAAENFFNTEAGITETKTALDGAKQILMERFSEDAELLAILRDKLWLQGELQSRVVSGQEQAGEKFSDYFEHNEAIHKTPSHRALAMFRGRNEGVLQLAIVLPEAEELKIHPCETMIAKHFNIKDQLSIEDQQRPADTWLKEVVRWTWRVKLLTHIETELMTRLREAAEAEAIKVFAGNLKDLLLAAPAGPRATLGLDPGLRTGVKVAVVDRTGKLLDYATIYPHVPRNQWRESLAVLAALVEKHHVDLISIGNGTASRETDKLAADLVKRVEGRKISKIMVSEAGASVYSASELAAKEFPDLDVSIRGAVSIARRLQDPLAELVKIDPKSIGVGQYQHDVSQTQLARGLEAVVEDCVNAVGVDVNTASVALLTRVSGLNTTLAQNIITYRDENGAFDSRTALKKVSRLGPKAFEQCAGFLRIMDGKNPLDASAVHPEAYPVVKKIAENSGRKLDSLMGDSGFLKGINPIEYTDENFGLPTVTDILTELEKPGRDPRPEFKAAEFMEGVEEISDLKPGMILEGAVTNVTNFGAFVDVGVHQDGLVHISALSNSFVEDPRTVVKAGDIVQVKVMDVDQQRRRIALSMRLNDEPEAQQSKAGNSDGNSRGRRYATKSNTSNNNGSSSNGQSNGRNNPQNQKGQASVGTLGMLLAQAQQKQKK